MKRNAFIKALLRAHIQRNKIRRLIALYDMQLLSENEQLNILNFKREAVKNER